jgi:hypothetical protein
MAKRTPRSRPANAPATADDAALATGPARPATDINADDTRSQSMASEPNEEDIRLRAYQRYLERGRGHGLAFDDWVEAERELKGAK